MEELREKPGSEQIQELNDRVRTKAVKVEQLEETVRKLHLLFAQLCAQNYTVMVQRTQENSKESA